MVTIFYFHGYNSNGNSRTVGMVKNILPDAHILSPTYCTTDADIAMSYLDTMVSAALQQNSKMMLVGNSLGGFFANYFSNKYKLPVLLINPSFDPAVSLEKHNPIDNINCSSFQKYYIEDVPGTLKFVVLGVKDEVIPYRSFMSRFNRGYKIFINDNMGHRVSSEDEIRVPLQELVGMVND